MWGFTGNPDHCLHTEIGYTSISQGAIKRYTDSETLPSEAKSHQSDSVVADFGTTDYKPKHKQEAGILGMGRAPSLSLVPSSLP